MIALCCKIEDQNKQKYKEVVNNRTLKLNGLKLKTRLFFTWSSC